MPVRQKLSTITKWLLSAILLLFFIDSFSQNLVINGGMEDIRKMPLPKKMAIDGMALEFEEDSSYFQPLIGEQHPLAIVAAPGWQYTRNDSINFSAVRSSKDYSNTGTNFNTILVYRGSSVGKDASVKNVVATLCRPLIQGKDYLVSFYLKPFSGTAFTSNVGVAFIDKQIPTEFQFPQEVPSKKGKNQTTSSLRQLDLKPAYQLPSILEDTSGYTLIQFVYTAKGGENYVYIGNLFFETEKFWLKEKWKQTRHFGYENHYSQYFICYYALDDLEVVPIDKNEILCTAKPDLEAKASLDTIFLSSIFYKTDSINAESNHLALVEYINSAPTEYAVLIVGHADKEGSAEYNLKLSRKRAEAVKLLLSAINKKAITVGVGSEFSLLEPTDQFKNRRVDIYLIKADVQ